jgi:hypothetical protein
MGKFLAIGGVVLVVLAILLLHELKGTASVDATPAKSAVVDHPADTIAPTPLPAAPVVAAPPIDPDKPQKISKDSDAFVFEFDDVQPKRLMKAVAKCYQSAGINRVPYNSKLKFTFNDRIVNGEVTVTDVKLVESTVNNKALELCMADKVASYHWHNDMLPDYVGEDMLLVRPEQTLKKYQPENMNYQGDGPEFKGYKAQTPYREERPAKE